MDSDAGRRGSIRRVYTGPDAGKRPAPMPGTQPATQQPPTRQPPVDRGPAPAPPPPDGAPPASPNLTEQHQARVLAELQTKGAALLQRVVDASDAVTQARATHQQTSRAVAAESAEAARQQHAATLAQAAEETERQRGLIREGLAAIAADHAAGAFAAGWDEPWTAVNHGRSGGPDLVRRGSLGATPALYPLFHDVGWYLKGPTADTLEEVQTVLLRMVAALPLKHVRIDVYDPRIEGRMGGLAPLRAVHSDMFPTPATTPNALRAMLDSVATTAAANAEAIATDRARHLGDLWQRRGVPEGSYRAVVLLNYPDGVDRESQAQLLRLARSGGPNGVLLLVQADDTAQPTDDAVRARDLEAALNVSNHHGAAGIVLAGYPEGVVATPDGRAPDALFQSVIDAAAGRAREDTGPVVPLSGLIAADAASPWTGSAADGVEATIGRIGQRDVTIAFRSQNPPVANMLIGGAVGQGKSNLLLDIIYALAARYSPDELEFHLLDFKRGLEFQRFAPDAAGINWLPHVRTLSLESDRDFGVAVLRRIAAILEQRAIQFKKVGASGIEDFRARTGEPMTRLILIVDEFQVLFDGDDRLVDEAVVLLETLSRQGRASGVHLLLASQTTSGVSGLRVKGESIFSQFPVRMSLKNTVSESEAILSGGNKAAASLTYRGEVIINRNFGHDPEGSNERAISAYAEPEFVAGLQAELWMRAPNGPRPLVFISTAFAPPVALPEPSSDGTATAYVGMPLEVSSVPVALQIEEDVDQAIAVIGPEPTLALPVLVSVAASLVASARIERVIVVDLAATDSADAGKAMATTLDTWTAAGVEVTRVGRDDALGVMLGQVREAATTRGGPRTLVLGLGWQRWQGVDDYHPVGDDDYATASLREALEALGQRGALGGVYLLAWWTTLRSAKDHLGYALVGVRHVIAAKLGLEDYRDLAGPSVSAVTGFPRVVHFDRYAQADPVTAIPFLDEGADA